MAEKSSHEEAEYEKSSHRYGKFCAICEHFVKPHCTKVKDPIAPRGYCKWWEQK